MRPLSRGGMRPSAKPDSALFAERLRIALAKKGWKAAELARQIGVSRQLAASWTRGRAIAAGPSAVRLPGLLGVDEDWLFPKGAGTGIGEPGMPLDGRSPSSRGQRPGIASASVRGAEAKEVAWKGFRVLAGRIARTVQQVIAGNELGYTAASRLRLADSLEVFANDLDARCKEKVSGDIWEVIAWLRKPPS